MNNQEIIKRMRQEVKKLAHEQGIEPFRAFLAWSSMLLIPNISEDDAIESSYPDGSNDLGIDFVYIDDENQDIYFFQGKYSEVKCNTEWGLKLMKGISDLDDPDKLKRRNATSDIINFSKKYRLAKKQKPHNIYPYVVHLGYCTKSGKESFPEDCQYCGIEELKPDWEDKKALREAKVPDEIRLTLHGFYKFPDKKNRARCLIGAVSLLELYQIYQIHTHGLFVENVRRWKGAKNRINKKIKESAENHTDGANFFFYNNGISILCEKFSPLKEKKGGRKEKEEENIKTFIIKKCQIINGAQTVYSIGRMLDERSYNTPQN